MNKPSGKIEAVKLFIHNVSSLIGERRGRDRITRGRERGLWRRGGGFSFGVSGRVLPMPSLCFPAIC